MTPPPTLSPARRLAAAVTLAGAAAVLASCSAAQTPDVVDLQVFGASSTRVINEQLAAAAGELDPPVVLQFNNDGSGTLVAQLLEGAPADVLITADEQSMDRAVADGSVQSPHRLAHNFLVMVVPAGNPAGVGSVADLAAPDVDLVLCDPRVPCGDASARLLGANGLNLDPVSLESAVGDVLGKVQNGEADAGWVYRTDALAAGEDVEIIDIPGAEQTPNTLLVAATTGTGHPAQAQQLVDLILSPDVAADLAEAGFTPAQRHGRTPAP